MKRRAPSPDARPASASCCVGERLRHILAERAAARRPARSHADRRAGQPDHRHRGRNRPRTSSTRRPMSCRSAARTRRKSSRRSTAPPATSARKSRRDLDYTKLHAEEVSFRIDYYSFDHAEHIEKLLRQERVRKDLEAEEQRKTMTRLDEGITTKTRNEAVQAPSHRPRAKKESCALQDKRCRSRPLGGAFVLRRTHERQAFPWPPSAHRGRILRISCASAENPSSKSTADGMEKMIRDRDTNEILK